MKNSAKDWVRKNVYSDSDEDPSSFAANALIDLFVKNKINPNEIGEYTWGLKVLLIPPNPQLHMQQILLNNTLKKILENAA